MKKKIMCLTMALMLCMAGTVFADDGIKVTVDGKALTETGVTVEGRTMVPMRAICEALGAKVDWDEAQQKVTITKTLYQASSSGNMTSYDRNVQMVIGDKQMKVDGEGEALDVPAQIIGGKTMVPARAVSDSLDATVKWDDATKTVSISSSLSNSPQGAQWDSQHTQMAAEQATSEYMKKVNEEADVERAEKLEEDKKAGVLSAYGYNLGNVYADNYTSWPGLNIQIGGAASAKEEFLLNVVDRQKSEVVYSTTFKYPELKESGTFHVLNLPLQYLNDDKFDYEFTVVVK